MPPAATSAGPGGRVVGLPTRPAQQRQRIDDLVHEVGGRGWLRLRAAPLAWGFGGFLIGAIFWHAIGFWGFLGDVILKSPEPRVSVVARSAPPESQPNCTALAIDRASGRTRSIPCVDALHFHEEASLGRQDLASIETRTLFPAQDN